MSDVQSAVERIFPLVYEFRKPLTPADEELLRQKRAARAGAAPPAPPPDEDPMRLVTLSDDDKDAWEWRGRAARASAAHWSSRPTPRAGMKRTLYWHRSNNCRLLVRSRVTRRRAVRFMPKIFIRGGASRPVRPCVRPRPFGGTFCGAPALLYPSYVRLYRFCDDLWPL